MAYLGTPPQSGFITTSKQRVTSSTNAYVDLDHAISSIADVIVFVNFVKQDTTNLTLTTSTRITLGDTLVSSDIVEIHYLGKAVNTQTPGTGTVTADALAGSIGLDKLSATGTKSSSTFLRGDNTFATAGISGVTSSSSSTALSIDANGHVTKPLQSCFMGTIDYAGGNNCTGDGTTVILGSSDATVTERFDQNNDFTTGTFTCPVTGRYYIGGVLTMINIASNHTEARVDLEASNRTIYQRFNPNNYKTSGGPNGIGYSFGTLIDADANDTLKLKFYVSGGSKDADTQSDGSLFMYLVA